MSIVDTYNHLIERGCRPSIYGDSLILAEDRATFLLYTLTGKLGGYQTYKPGAPKTKDGKGLDPKELRYFTHMTRSQPGLPESVLLFGFEQFDWTSKFCFIVEGIFDAVKLHAMGFNALAVLANDPATFRAWKACYPHMTFICLADNDKAGIELAKQCDLAFTVPAPYKDTGDMPSYELLKFLMQQVFKVL